MLFSAIGADEFANVISAYIMIARNKRKILLGAWQMSLLNDSCWRVELGKWRKGIVRNIFRVYVHDLASNGDKREHDT